MTYVHYIDKTREYYLAAGYEKPYAWAHFDDVPFTPLAKPLARCRATIVSTSEVAVRGDAESEALATETMVGNAYSIPSDTPVESLYSHQDAYDTHATHLDDVNSYLPISRLREAVEAGRLGSVAPRIHGVHTSYSQRRTFDVDGAEVFRRCREDGVDVVLLTPV